MAPCVRSLAWPGASLRFPLSPPLPLPLPHLMQARAHSVSLSKKRGKNSISIKLNENVIGFLLRSYPSDVKTPMVAARRQKAE